MGWPGQRARVRVTSGPARSSHLFGAEIIACNLALEVTPCARNRAALNLCARQWPNRRLNPTSSYCESSAPPRPQQADAAASQFAWPSVSPRAPSRACALRQRETDRRHFSPVRRIVSVVLMCHEHDNSNSLVSRSTRALHSAARRGQSAVDKAAGGHNLTLCPGRRRRKGGRDLLNQSCRSHTSCTWLTSAVKFADGERAGSRRVACCNSAGVRKPAPRPRQCRIRAHLRLRKCLFPLTLADPCANGTLSPAQPKILPSRDTVKTMLAHWLAVVALRPAVRYKAGPNTANKRSSRAQR